MIDWDAMYLSRDRLLKCLPQEYLPGIGYVATAESLILLPRNLVMTNLPSLASDRKRSERRIMITFTDLSTHRWTMPFTRRASSSLAIASIAFLLLLVAVQPVARVVPLRAEAQDPVDKPADKPSDKVSEKPAAQQTLGQDAPQKAA